MLLQLPVPARRPQGHLLCGRVQLLHPHPLPPLSATRGLLTMLFPAPPCPTCMRPAHVRAPRLLRCSDGGAGVHLPGAHVRLPGALLRLQLVHPGHHLPLPQAGARVLPLQRALLPQRRRRLLQRLQRVLPGGWGPLHAPAPRAVYDHLDPCKSTHYHPNHSKLLIASRVACCSRDARSSMCKPWAQIVAVAIFRNPHQPPGRHPAPPKEPPITHVLGQLTVVCWHRCRNGVVPSVEHRMLSRQLTARPLCRTPAHMLTVTQCNCCTRGPTCACQSGQLLLPPVNPVNCVILE
jgi:hypothetical protein